ncbi:MAG: hypothetical protein Ct9H90mP4_07620 [Gammaproteobacteria bacterium]|nr:MAG: hypothetical protein Ct9H90mP4_07620 [Gammaproteobacteria bacterium]
MLRFSLTSSKSKLPTEALLIYRSSIRTFEGISVLDSRLLSKISSKLRKFSDPVILSLPTLSIYLF